jgi:hypothetical protein
VPFRFERDACESLRAIDSMSRLIRVRKDGTRAARGRFQSDDTHGLRRTIMGFGRGALLWLLGIPLPIIILLALFWHN